MITIFILHGVCETRVILVNLDAVKLDLDYLIVSLYKGGIRESLALCFDLDIHSLTFTCKNLEYSLEFSSYLTCYSQMDFSRTRFNQKIALFFGQVK